MGQVDIPVRGTPQAKAYKKHARGSLYRQFSGARAPVPRVLQSSGLVIANLRRGAQSCRLSNTSLLGPATKCRVRVAGGCAGLVLVELFVSGPWLHTLTTPLHSRSTDASRTS